MAAYKKNAQDLGAHIVFVDESGFLEMLPPYAPELNLDEGVWSQVKNSMANSRCDNIDDLWVHILEELIKLSLSQTNLRACIHRSELPPL